MPFTTIYFREAEAIIKANRMQDNFIATMEELDLSLATFHYRGTTLKSVLEHAGWRGNNDNLNILPGRRYQYKGIWQKIAIEANLYFYEYLWDGLFRLQLGYDHGKIDTGILLLPGQRSDKSPLGSTVNLVKVEVEELFPTISLPVAIVLFDFTVNGTAREDASQVQTTTNTFKPTAMEAAI